MSSLKTPEEAGLVPATKAGGARVSAPDLGGKHAEEKAYVPFSSITLPSF